MVSYFHPPFPGAGGNRWLAMSHYLRELGYSVNVIACSAWGVLPSDTDLGVTRVGDLRSLGVLRRLLKRGELPVGGGAEVLERPAGALLTKVVVPDLHALGWVPAVVLRIRRMLARGEIDCLVTSSPPASAHLVGLLLGRPHLPWIADFRDGWRFQDGREPFPTAAQRRLDALLEERVARGADAVVGATAPITADLEARLGVTAFCVPNGWDPELSPQEGSAPHISSEGVVTLALTGTLSGVRGRDPRPLFEALRIIGSEPSLGPIRLVHAGPLTTEERVLIDSVGSDLIEHVGYLDRGAALALQRSANALVLLTSRNSSEATSKIYEYLASGRPIIALAEGNEAARIVRETKTGITVPPDDVPAIVGALRSAASGELWQSYAPHGLEAFTYPGPAIAMAEAIVKTMREAGRRQKRGDERG